MVQEEFKIPTGSNIAAVLLKKEASESGSLHASSFDVLLKDDTGIKSYSFLLDGRQQGTAKALTPSEIEKINVKEALDLENTGIIGIGITEEIFNPSNGTGYTANDSQTRHIYNSSAGVVISKNALSVGSDLRDYTSTTSPVDELNGPEFTLVKHTDLALAGAETIVGIRRTISGYSNTGFEFIISDTQNPSQKRILAVDNDGSPLTAGSNYTINEADLRFQLMELNTGIDLNNDGKNGFTITQSDLVNEGLHHELNRRISLTSNDAIILSKESLPTGNITSNNLTHSFLRYDNWNGPGAIVLADSNGAEAFKADSNQTILGARIVRKEETTTFSPPTVERAELFISVGETTQVLKFNLDGTNSGIASYAGIDILESGQISEIELETGFDLTGNNVNGLTVTSVLYNPSENGSSTNEQDRYVAETIDGNIVLSRETISDGSIIRGTNSTNKPIILSDSEGNPITLSTINSVSESKVVGARSILFEPKGWTQQSIDDVSSAIGFNVYVEATSDNNSVEVISFNADGQQVSRSTLSTEELLSAEVRENIDLNNDNLIGGTIQSQLFTPDGGGSDRRYLYKRVRNTCFTNISQRELISKPETLQVIDIQALHDSA